MSSTSVNKVSIWLGSGGHTFSKEVEGTDDSVWADMRRCAEVEVVVDTHKTALVPEAYVDGDNLSRHLGDLALSVASDESVVCSRPVGGIVAVMAVSSDAVAILQRVTKGVAFTSPLLVGEPLERGTLFELSSDTLYVRVYDGGLRFAEALRVESDGDILFVFETLHRAYGIYNMYARAKGDTDRIARLTKGCFKSITLCQGGEV